MCIYLSISIRHRLRRLNRGTSVVLLAVSLLGAACTDTNPTDQAYQPQPIQLTAEPAVSVEEATAIIETFERDYNEAVRGGIDAAMQFQADSAWPGVWAVAGIECAVAPTSMARDLYENASSRKELSLTNPRVDSDWVVPDFGQPGAGDQMAEAAWLVDAVIDGVETQMHVAIHNGRGLFFPSGPPCPIADIAPSENDADVALVWREIDSCRLGTTSWCRTWVVRIDGSVASERLGTDAVGALAYEGSVDRALVAEWLRVLEVPGNEEALTRSLHEACRTDDGVDFDRHVAVPSRSMSVSTCSKLVEQSAAVVAPLRTLLAAVIAELPTDGAELYPCDWENLGPDDEC